MRIFIGIVLVLVMQKEIFAQSTLPSSSPKDTAAKQVKKTIDRLNDAAHNTYLGSPDSARSLAEKALILAEKAKYKVGTGRAFLNIGRVYWSQSYYSLALLYLNKALMNMPADQPLLISACYEVTGRAYADLGNYREAFNSLDNAEHFAGNDPATQAEVHSERSFVYMKMKDFDRALKETNEALRLNNIAKEPGNKAILYGRLSGIYRQKKLYKEALAYSDTAYRMSITSHNNRLRALTNVEYANINIQLHNFDKALAYAKTGAALADSIGAVSVLTSAYRTIINCYEFKNDLKEAMAYQKKYNSKQDSLTAFEKAKSTELIQAYFALNNRLNEIAAFESRAEEIKAQVKSQRLVIILLSFSLLAVIALLSVTYYYYKQKKELNKQLNIKHKALLEHKQLIEAQTDNLQTTSKVKDKLLAVIGHDLRTPLANLRNMVEMFEADYISPEEVHELMKEINPLVKSAELTLSNLMQWASNNIKGRSVQSSNLDIFLLGVEMEQTFSHALQQKNIEFINNADAGQSVIADENHIKVVLRNLISNAIKFTDSKGYIKLESTCKENKMIISIQDNGKGMTPEEIGLLFYPQTHFSQPGTLGEHGTGIGLLLCKELVELNGGSLWISSVPHQGSTFFFSLPMNRAYA